MRKTLLGIGILFLLAASALGAQPVERFQKGGWEFGGHLLFDYLRSAPISEESDGDGIVEIDVEGAVGFFPVNNLAVTLYPQLMYVKQVMSGGDDVSKNLGIGLKVGGAWYFPLGDQAAVSVGLRGGLMVIPGLDDVDTGAPDPDDSLNLTWTLQPLVSAYLFLGERLAPYLQTGPQFLYTRGVKDASGDAVVYPSGYNFLDEILPAVAHRSGHQVLLPPPGQQDPLRQDVGRLRRVLIAPEAGHSGAALRGRPRFRAGALGPGLPDSVFDGKLTLPGRVITLCSVDFDRRYHRARKSAEGSLTSGLIFTLAFGVLLVVTRMWWWVFPLVFAGLLPAVSGLQRLMRSRLDAREHSGDREAWAEKQVLRAARDGKGVVTPALVALKTELSIEAAEQVLERLARRGYAEMRVSPGGRIEYSFPEFLPDGGKGEGS